jgi:tetratricopeptide (TPR) repeat protein
LATDYLDAGLYAEAADVLGLAGPERETGERSPMIDYYLAYLSAMAGDAAQADRHLAGAAQRSPNYGFPFRLESVEVLEAALERQPRDARAHYYLGNLLYELQPDRALRHWEKACELEPALAVAHRNLGWAYQRHLNDAAKAIASYERAIGLNPRDPRYYLELDDLYERSRTSPEARLAMLQRNPEITVLRKDLLIRRIRLLVATRDYRRAIDLLSQNRFIISEGGGRELGDAYVDAHLLRGITLLQNGDAGEARTLFQAATAYPENLSQESSRNERRMPQIRYWLACAERALGNEAAAKPLFEELAGASGSRSRETQFYQALAQRALGRDERAQAVAEDLVGWATQQLGSEAETDVFAKFGEQQTLQAQRAEAHYVMGLGLLALERAAEAAAQFDLALAANPAHAWAAYYAAHPPAP